MAERSIIHVVAAVLRDRYGKILLTERPPGKHLAGLWEFPGGKREAGETPEQALRRELHEEIGVEAGTMRRLICFPWQYPEKSILLDVYEVADYTGVPHGNEGQRMQWVAAGALLQISMPAADGPIVAALRLPHHYAISPEPTDNIDDFFARLSQVFESGVGLVQLRAKTLAIEIIESLSKRALWLARQVGAKLLLNQHVELAIRLGFDGVHLTAAQVDDLGSRPAAEPGFLIGASCHSAAELQAAAEMKVDFAVLGPVAVTQSHPESPALGWDGFYATIQNAALPVYALGGLRQSDFANALSARAQGIAGIGAFWPTRN